MADQNAVTVNVIHNDADHFEFEVGAQGLPHIAIDRTGFTKDELSNDHYGARLLCTAVLACFTNTFYNALVREGAEVKGISAQAVIEKEKDQMGRTRYVVMHVDVVVDVDEKDREAFEVARDFMESGSLVSYSLEDAIEMDITMRMKRV